MMSQALFPTLQMLQKPPVVFTRHDPAKVLGPVDWAYALGRASRRSEVAIWLWMCYGRSILAEVDPCMEANEGAAATLALTRRDKSLSRMEVSRISGETDGFESFPETYEMKIGDARLYLTETEAGDVFLYFFRPDRHPLREERRIDLTDFGSDAAAYFIATLFRSYESIARYYETCEKC